MIISRQGGSETELAWCVVTGGAAAGDFALDMMADVLNTMYSMLNMMDFV